MGITLTGFRRIPLGTWPTLLQEAPRLSEMIGRRVLIKRDDVGELGLAGNKVRKLEFLLGDAVDTGADTVITLGALQSNHARLTAAAAARLGLRCELVLYRSVPRSGAAYEESGNMLLDRLFGAVVHTCATRAEAESFAEELAEKRRAAGRNALIVPVGGSNGLGSLGYVAAAAEIEAQLRERDIEQARIIAPLGSCGTAAGLVVGGSRLPWSFDFPCVRAAAEPSRADLSQMVSQTADVLGIAAPSMEKVRVTDRTLGAGYGQPTEGVWQALRTVAGREGVVLDPVYTGKAAHHLLTATDFEPDVPIVFVHTGGASGLFGYAPEATRSLTPNG